MTQNQILIKNIFFAIGCLFFLLFANKTLADSVDLSWEASPDLNVAGYKIYYDTQSHASGTCPNDYANYANPIIVENGTDYTITGLVAGQTYYFQITAYDTDNNESICSYDPGEQSVTIIATTTETTTSSSSESNSDSSTNSTTVSSNSSGGGGGSSATPSIDNLSNKNDKSASLSPVTPPTDLKDVTSLSPTGSEKNQSPVTTITTGTIITAEAEVILNYNDPVALSPANLYLYSKVMSTVSDVNTEQEKNSVSYFLQNGTPSTIILGAGERAGVISSYISVFSHLPKTEADWQDVVKIANGRWTTERNLNAENSANKIFKKIFLRAPKRDTIKYDDNAIMVMAYGLRPAKRNVGSETAAIKSFKYIFKRSPSQANDWDIIRAIAYSGAKR
jgi:hypothetical protein